MRYFFSIAVLLLAAGLCRAEDAVDGAVHKSSAQVNYEQWVSEHKPAKDEDYNLPVYPGSVIQYEERKSSSCYEVELLADDSFKKIVSFYKEKLKGQLKEHFENGLPDRIDFHMGDVNFEIGAGESGPEVIGRKGGVNRFAAVIKPSALIMTNYMYIDGNGAYKEKRAAVIVLQSRVLDGSCVDIPDGALLREDAAPREREKYR